jgi:starch phosphorylase
MTSQNSGNRKSRSTEAPATRPAESLKQDILRHVLYSLGRDTERPDRQTVFRALALSLRDRLVEKWIASQREIYSRSSKRVYYLSLEFLPGPFLRENLISLGLENEAREALTDMGFGLDDVADEEYEPGLGNGGLGRLASCYLDSMATLRLPAYGYGIRYAYGIFYQHIKDGRQVERADNWLRGGTHWEFERSHYVHPVRFYGQVREWVDEQGRLRHSLENATTVMAMACDMFIPGHKNDYVLNMRLWAAKTSREFEFSFFNTGDYIGAVEEKIRDENISMVLYPNDEAPEGKELRLKQQFFLVSATIQDIVRRFRKKGIAWDQLPRKNVIHLNETHPAVAIPELMRILVDEELLTWEEAWYICVRTFAYTNHTVLPEALEVWPEDLFRRLLPRHLQIIHEINRRFLHDVRRQFPNDPNILGRVSLVHEGESRWVRMSHLAIVGSFSVNGVSAHHSEILKESVFHDFYKIFPERFNNKTNGITPRRWLRQCNPTLAWLITEHIGPEWLTDLAQLKKLEPYVNSEGFHRAWMEVRLRNKNKLAEYIRDKNGITVMPESLFDVHVKRFHEYKRQLLNVLHVIALYNRIRNSPGSVTVPRTYIFGGKAAPGYYMAKHIIRLINSVAYTINTDPRVGDLLKVVFLQNYCVSLAERIIPATDLSEQISTAGMEASGTGNMKFALNGAITIGTHDGANIEIMEHVGNENLFLFGLLSHEVNEMRSQGYNPRIFYERDSELREVLDMIAGGFFSPSEPHLFRDVVESLLNHGDRYMVLADFRSYVYRQQDAANAFMDQTAWARMSMLNTSRMGFFSSDRAVDEYAKDIWGVSGV